MHKLSILAIAFAFHALAAEPCRQVSVKNENELWVHDGTASRLLIRDAQGVNLPRWSPDHAELLYAHDFNFNGDPVSSLVIVDADGRVRRQIAVNYDDGVNAFTNLGWVSRDVVWAEGHATPSSGVYHEWNVRTGQQLTEKWGSAFVWSPNGKLLAQRGHIPHGAPNDFRVEALINGQPVRLQDGASSKISALAWSPDSSTLAVALKHDHSSSIELVDAGTRKSVRAFAIPVAAAKSLQWQDADTIAVDTIADSWLISASTGKAERAPVHAVSAPCSSLSR